MGMIANHRDDVTRLAPFTTIVAAVLAALAGASLKRLCVGRQYSYEIRDSDPDRRPSTDVWLLHAGIVLAAGAATGALLGLCFAYDAIGGALACGLSGAACALVFVPICLAVVAAARRAQRARLGSLVAGSDRRAIPGILAITLAVGTLEALPEWHAAALGTRAPPLIALGMVMSAALVTAGLLRADRLALLQARKVIASGLSAREPDELEQDDSSIARLDLGLGDELQARSVRGAAAYRQRERTLALVRGSPGRALDALRRAVRMGVFGLAVIATVGGGHALAATTAGGDCIAELRRWISTSICAATSQRSATKIL